jgi:hypothetical protein
MTKDIIQQINLNLKSQNIPEHIRIDDASMTPNGN